MKPRIPCPARQPALQRPTCRAALATGLATWAVLISAAPAWAAPAGAAAAATGAAASAPASAPASTPAASVQPAAADEPSRYVAFVQEFASTCVQRNGVQIQVRNTHPQRTVRVWLDRFHMGVGTGDRSRSELKPGAEPEPLGCSRTTSGVQEWRIARAQFVD